MATLLPPVRAGSLIGGEWSAAARRLRRARSPANLAEVVGTFPTATPAEVNAGGRRRPGRVPRRGGGRSRILRAELLRPPRPAHQARHRRPRRADGPRVRQGRHRVPGRGGRRAAHGAVRLRHRPDADRRGASRRRSPRRTPSCAASRGAWSRSSRRGTSRSPCRCGCSGRACSKATRPSSSRPRTRRPSASGSSSCSSRPASRRATINLVHGDGAVGEALVQQSRRERRAVHRQLRGRASASSRSRPSMPDRIVAAEMGGKSAVIVCEDARLDLAVTAGILSGVQDERPALRVGGPHPGARDADRRATPKAFVDDGEAAAVRRPARRRATSPARSSTRTRSRRC